MEMFKFISTNFSKMPKWVQVISWFIMLFLTVYLYISPRFINGHTVIQLPNGGALDYRGAILRTHIAGRVLKYKTNEDGYWSVPVVSRIPQSMTLELYHEDKHAWFEVKLDAQSIWMNNLGMNLVKIVVGNDNQEPVKLELASQLDEFNDAVMQYASAMISLVVPAAHADTDASEVTATNAMSKQEVINNIKVIMADVLNTKPADISLQHNLVGKSAPSYFEKLQIIQRSEQMFNIKLQDEEWRLMATVGELSDYINNKINE